MCRGFLMGRVRERVGGCGDGGSAPSDKNPGARFAQIIGRSRQLD